MKSARDAYREGTGLPHPKLPKVIMKLAQFQIPHLMIPIGKAKEPYLNDEAYTSFARQLKEEIEAQATKRAEKKARRAIPTPTSTPPAWKDEMESLILEQEGRIDALHKAVEAMQGVYLKLREEIDPSRVKEMPELPPLPPRYIAKVVIVGSDGRIPEALRPIFPTLKILHVGESRKGVATSALPRGDLILAMTSFLSHPMRDRAWAFYGKEHVVSIQGSTTSAENAIRVWLHDREERERAAA